MEDKNKLIGIVAISVIFVLFIIVILIAIFGGGPPPPPPPSLLDDLKNKAIGGDVTAAEKLATLGKTACPAMLDVVEQASDLDVRVACIEGLRTNKYFEAGPVLFKILDPGKDDGQAEDIVILRHQAYLATTKFMSDHFYNARAPYDERKEKVREMRGEWEGKKRNMEAKAAAG